MKDETYTVRFDKDGLYKKLRIKAAQDETSIQKTILRAIKEYVEKEEK